MSIVADARKSPIVPTAPLTTPSSPPFPAPFDVPYHVYPFGQPYDIPQPLLPHYRINNTLSDALEMMQAEYDAFAKDASAYCVCPSSRAFCADVLARLAACVSCLAVPLSAEVEQHIAAEERLQQVWDDACTEAVIARHHRAAEAVRGV